jgi:hypothetical protein
MRFGHMTILTEHWPPPIGTNKFDWAAWRDGDDEEGRVYGWGASEQDAIDDLLMTLGEDCDN